MVGGCYIFAVEDRPISFCCLRVSDEFIVMFLRGFAEDTDVIRYGYDAR